MLAVVMALGVMVALTLVGAEAIPGSCVDLLLLDPVVERLRHAADLGCN